MSHKNVSLKVLLLLVCGVLFSLPASAQHFQQVKGTLFSVAAGRNEVFGLGPTGLPLRYNASTKSFAKVGGATSLVQIAVGGGTLSQLDEVWAVGDNGNVYRFNFTSKTFKQIPGQGFVQVTVGEGAQDDCHPYEVWAVEGEGQLATRYNYCASQFEGGLGPVAQCVTEAGDVWGLSSSGQIFHFFSTAKEQGAEGVAGILSQIAVGADTVWGIDGSEILRYDPSTSQFVQVSGDLQEIAAGADGVWGIAPGNTVFRFDPGTASWIQAPGSLATISVGSGAGVWGVSPSNQVFTFLRP
jgi:hypothetical protein